LFTRRHIPEEILGTIHEVSGHTFDIVYDLYLTTDRVIAVLIRHPSDVASLASWSSLFIGGWGSRRKEEQEFEEIASERHGKSKNMSPDELLASNPHNFQISNKDITAIELKKGLSNMYHIKLQLNVPGKKLRRDFMVPKDQLQETIQLLTKAFPAKFKPD
jgi:hypothetical protein